MLRTLSGTITGGVVVLTIVVIGAAIVGSDRGFPGPGTSSIVWHVVAVVVALLLQRFADRRRSFLSALSSLGVVAVAGALLWTQWWGSAQWWG